MTAREELVRAVGKDKILCAKIFVDPFQSDPEDIKHMLLKVGHTPEELEEFLTKLEFEYDSGYGLQVLHGTVWLEGGSWLERGEYDGSEWWEYKKYPEIDEDLK